MLRFQTTPLATPFPSREAYSTMKTNPHTIALFLGALIAATALPLAAAQEAPVDRSPADRAQESATGAKTGASDRPLSLGFSDQASVSWVLVPVVVRGTQGYVRGLEADSFRLWVDQQPIAIETFDSGPGIPTALLYMQDLSGSMALGGKLAASNDVFACILERARPGDLLALASFSAGEAELDLPFTSALRIARTWPSAWRPYGKTALHNAIAAMPDLHSAYGSELRRAVVLVTDGADNASTLAPEAARDLLRRAELPVYVLSLERERTAADDREATALALRHRLLQDLAEVSGGHFFSAPDSQALNRACTTIFSELQHQYVLGFRSSVQGQSAYRSIRVTLKGGTGIVDPKLIHRQGYSGNPPQ